ncbi:MAG: TlpA disulfide reductase family protein, partial [Candidatus Binatia bacterium]
MARHTSTRKNVAALAVVAGLLLVWTSGGGATGPGGESGHAAAVPSSGLVDSERRAAIWRPLEGHDLIGTKAPPWRDIEWIQGGPLDLGELNRDGKAVLVRFWLTGCPYCRRTAPALRSLWRRYRDDGLVVVGLHHPKSMEA